MPSGRKVRVRGRLILTIFAVIFLCWGLSAGAFLLFSSRDSARLHRELEDNPSVTGLARVVARRLVVLRPVTISTPDGKQMVLIIPFPARGLMPVRLGIALLLALAVGAGLSRWFTRRMETLAAGARAFHAGDLSYRLPVAGEDEFSRVASAMNDMADRLATQIADLEQDGRRRRQLLADVAHELRSPVATLKTMTEALRDGVAEDPARRAQALGAVLTAADRLEGLVADLLEVARLDLHELPLNRERVDLRALAREAGARHAQAAAEGGLTLLPVQEGEPLPVEADPARIAQILDNLLDNAVAYAGAGATVTVSVFPGDPAQVVVADTGRGLAPEHLPFVFDPFYRADSARTPGVPHSGLGLRIARGLAEAHGGGLSLDSEVGHGTKVTLALPGGNAYGNR